MTHQAFNGHLLVCLSQICNHYLFFHCFVHLSLEREIIQTSIFSADALCFFLTTLPHNICISLKDIQNDNMFRRPCYGFPAIKLHAGTTTLPISGFELFRAQKRPLLKLMVQHTAVLNPVLYLAPSVHSQHVSFQSWREEHKSDSSDNDARQI